MLLGWCARCTAANELHTVLLCSQGPAVHSGRDLDYTVEHAVCTAVRDIGLH